MLASRGCDGRQGELRDGRVRRLRWGRERGVPVRVVDVRDDGGGRGGCTTAATGVSCGVSERVRGTFCPGHQ